MLSVQQWCSDPRVMEWGHGIGHGVGHGVEHMEWGIEGVNWGMEGLGVGSWGLEPADYV